MDISPNNENHPQVATTLAPFSDSSKSLQVATTIAPFSSSLKEFKGYKPAGGQKLELPAVIPQTERLFTTRSRSVNHQDGGGDRGERAYIKVLTTDTKRSLDRKSSQAHGVSNPTSLDGGVLKDAVTGKGYASFLLTDVNCALEEKLQIVEVFGDAEVSYYFGRQPIMFNFSGVLIDSVDNNWFVEWMEMYSHVMRGTELARNYELLQIVLPNMSIKGSITRTSWSQNSARDVDIPFQFTFMAKEITPIKTLSPNKPLTDDHVIDWKKSSGFLNQSSINSIKTNSVTESMTNLLGVIKDPMSSVKDYAKSLTGFGMDGTYSPPSNFMSAVTTGAGSNLSNLGSATSSLSGLFSGVNSNLSGVRASLFSPIYGVLSSLTKLIKNSGGLVSSVFNSFTSPLRNILRDIRSISSQAIGVVNMVNSQIHGLGNQFHALDRDIQNTLSSLKKTAGVITTSPKSVSSSLRELFNAGKFPLTTHFISTKGRSSLISSGRGSNPKLALLNSGKKHTPEQGAKL